MKHISHLRQSRPRFIRQSGLFFAGIMAMSVVLACGAETTHAAQQPSANGLLEQTNLERRSHDMSPLVLNSTLSTAAKLKAQDMFKQQYWAHTAPDGTTPWHWFEAAGYSYRYAGENLAKDYVSSEATLAAWMKSPNHRANVLDAHYTQVGFAVADGILKGKATTLVVALYGAPAGATLGAATSTRTTEATAFVRMVASIQPGISALLVGLMVLTGMLIVVTTARLHRSRLPRHLHRTSHYYHRIYKAAGLISIAITIISLYGSGQI